MPSGELVGTTLKLTTGREVPDGHSHFPTEWPHLINIYGGVKEVAYMFWFVVDNDGGSDARMEGDQKILGTYLVPDLLKNNSLSNCALKF